MNSTSTCSASFAGESENVPQGPEQRLCFGARAIEDDQCVALLLQIRCHSTPHDAETDKSNFHLVPFSRRCDELQR